MLTRDPVIQIHPSRFCNYRCQHCYSSSGPAERRSLPARTILAATARLAALGYRRAALSGGEPALYPEFAELVKGLHGQGLSPAVITNGTRPGLLLDAVAAGHLTQVSVSFDGPEVLHDTIRGKRGAFRAALNCLRALRGAGLAPGAVLSVTRASKPHIPALVDGLEAAGAGTIQLHPLAKTGRAALEARSLGPELSEAALARLILLAEVLRLRHPKLHIHCDAAPGAALPAAVPQTGALISPLVLREDGRALPFTYDAPDRFRLGRIEAPDALRCHVEAGFAEMLNALASDLSDRMATNFYREFAQSEPDRVVPAPGMV